MNSTISSSLNFAHNLYRKVDNATYSSTFASSEDLVEVSGQEASNLILQSIESNKPVIIGRFGSGELLGLLHYLNIRDNRPFLRKSLRYIVGRSTPFWWDRQIVDVLQYAGGLFPLNDETLNKFSELTLKSLPEINILGSWRKEEALVSNYLTNCTRVRLKDLEPYYHKEPWSKALKGKKVLVIHPFTDSISKQYEKRKLLFRNADILPDFELKTLTSIFTTPGNNIPFDSWFDVYCHLCDEINNIDFDLAIIGCSTYSLPIAHHVKKMGKQAIQLGGATQILFGIRGRRWENTEFFRGMFNKHWTRPMRSEYPTGHNTIEGGCYW